MKVKIICRKVAIQMAHVDSSGRATDSRDATPDQVHVLAVQAPDMDPSELQGAIDVARDALLEGREVDAVDAIAQVADEESALVLLRLMHEYPDEVTVLGDYDVKNPRPRFTDRVELGRAAMNVERDAYDRRRVDLANQWREPLEATRDRERARDEALFVGIDDE